MKINRRRFLSNTTSSVASLMLASNFNIRGSEIKKRSALAPKGKTTTWPPDDLLDPNLMRQGPAVGLRAVCNGVPLYGYGYSYIYGHSPDFFPGSTIQKGNAAPVRKLAPRKSWQVSDNRIGATPPRMPRTARDDIQPLLDIHLIDGDPQTYWKSRGDNGPDVEPAWIRIDLPREMRLQAVVLVPRKDGTGMPADLAIRLSRDGEHWDEIYHNTHQTCPKGERPMNIPFPAQPAKQIWIIGRKLPFMPYYDSFAFSLAEVQVIDENGENVALASRGTSVIGSSFETCITSQRETHRMLWATHYDLGVKWVRINYAGSVLNWEMVEREPGVYEIDPEADAAITQAVNNGCRIVFCLGFTNWLYADSPQPDKAMRKVHTWANEYSVQVGSPQPDEAMRKELFYANEFSVPLPSVQEPRMLEGFKRFVRFMVQQYKDRVDYFEIWNEESGGYGGWGDAPPELFTKWVKEVSLVIKGVHPDAKIVMGSLSGLGPRRKFGLDWLKTCFKAGIATSIDVIGFHGYYGAGPEDKAWLGFNNDIQEAKSLGHAYGFNGEFWQTEWCNFAPYPRPQNNPGLPWVTEMVKAKQMARFAIMNLAQGVLFFWNETWNDGHIDRDVGLFRNSFSGSWINPTQPQPVYYVLRTLCTVFDQARPTDLKLDILNCKKTIESHTFKLPSGDILISLCQTGNSQDVSPSCQADVRLLGAKYQHAIGIDTLNGTEEKVRVSEDGKNSLLKNILVKDYPVVLRLSVNNAKMEE